MADTKKGPIPENEKRNVRAVLLSKIGGVLVSDFSKDYKKLLSSTLDIKRYGYLSVTDFVKAMPDVVRLEFCNKQMAYKMFGVGDPNSFMSSWAQKAQGNTPPHSNRGHHKSDGGTTLDTDDAKKLLPNFRGLYTLCFPRQYMKDATQEDVEQKFCLCRSIKEVNIIPNFIFVRFGEKKEALQVLEAYGMELDMRIAEEKNYGQSKSGIKGNINEDKKGSDESEKGWRSGLTGAVRVFLGNINNEATQNDMADLCAGYSVSSIELKSHKVDKHKVFALVGFPAIDDADRFIADKNESIWLGRNLVVRQAHECSKQPMKESDNSDDVISSKDNLCTLGCSAKKESEFKGINQITSDIQTLACKKPEQPSAEKGRRQGSNSSPGLSKSFDMKTASNTYTDSSRSFDMKTASNTYTESSRSFDMKTASNTYTESSRSFDIKTATNVSAGSSRSFDNIRISPAGGSDHGHLLLPRKMEQQTDKVVFCEASKVCQNQQSQYDDMPALEASVLNEMPELEGDGTFDVSLKNVSRTSPDGQPEVYHGMPGLSKDGTIAVFVGNFPYDSTQESLYNLFMRYDCLDVKMINCSDTRQSTYAFVTLGNLKMAESAVIDLDQSFYNGRCLLVSMANNEKALRQKITNGDLENITCTLDVARGGNTQRSVTMKTGGHPSSLSNSITNPYQLHPLSNSPAKPYQLHPLSNSPTKPYQFQPFGGLLNVYMMIYKKLGGLTSTLVIRPKTHVDLLVTHVHDNTSFWAQDLSRSADMDLLTQIHDIIKDPYSRTGPARGMGRCVALFQDNWYRAWIVNTTVEMFEVFFIDFGNKCFLTNVYTSHTGPCVWEIPPVAHPFMLSPDCVPRNLKDMEMTVVSAEVVHPGRSDNNYVTEVKIAF